MVKALKNWKPTLPMRTPIQSHIVCRLAFCWLGTDGRQRNRLANTPIQSYLGSAGARPLGVLGKLIPKPAAPHQ